MREYGTLLERDIWAAANLLIKQHGDDAEIHAAMRADAMLEQGDVAGQTVWMRIKRAIRQLQTTDRPGSVH